MKIFRWIPFCSTAAITAGVFSASGVYDSPSVPQVAGPVASPPQSSQSPRKNPASDAPAEFAPDQSGKPLVEQMREFLFDHIGAEPAPEKLQALMPAIDKMTASELTAACQEAVATPLNASTGSLVQVLLHRWASLDPAAALEFIIERHPNGIAEFCRWHPAEAVSRFHSSTGWHPLEAALEHAEHLSGIWSSSLQTFVAAEAALPAHPFRDAASARMAAALNEAAENRNNPDPTTRANAEAQGQRWLAKLQAHGHSAGPLVAAVRYITSVRLLPAGEWGHGNSNLGIRPGTIRFNPDPTTRQNIAMAFWQTWSRDSEGIVSAVRAIPGQEERDAVAEIIAESMGCTPFLGAEKLALLRQTHSNWTQLEIVPSLLSIANEDAADIVAELPAGPIRDRGVLVLAGKQLADSPAAALNLAMQAGAAPNWNESVRAFFKSWSDRQPAAARAWLESQDATTAAFLR